MFVTCYTFSDTMESLDAALWFDVHHQYNYNVVKELKITYGNLRKTEQKKYTCIYRPSIELNQNKMNLDSNF